MNCRKRLLIKIYIRLRYELYAAKYFSTRRLKFNQNSIFKIMEILLNKAVQIQVKDYA